MPDPFANLPNLWAARMQADTARQAALARLNESLQRQRPDQEQPDPLAMLDKQLAGQKELAGMGFANQQALARLNMENQKSLNQGQWDYLERKDLRDYERGAPLRNLETTRANAAIADIDAASKDRAEKRALAEQAAANPKLWQDPGFVAKATYHGLTPPASSPIADAKRAELGEKVANRPMPTWLDEQGKQDWEAGVAGGETPAAMEQKLRAAAAAALDARFQPSPQQVSAATSDATRAWTNPNRWTWLGGEGEEDTVNAVEAASAAYPTMLAYRSALSRIGMGEQGLAAAMAQGIDKKFPGMDAYSKARLLQMLGVTQGN